MKSSRLDIAVAVLLTAGAAYAQSIPVSTAAQPKGPIPRMITVGAMNEQDAALLASQHAAIVRAARIYGYDVETGSWTTDQAACSGAPGYLIAQMSEGDTPARSFLTVLIPRNRGPIRIIPVLHRGILNSWMFGEDKLQREFLDQMIPVRAAGAESDGTGWSNLAGCYAALEGGELAGNSAGNLVIVDEGTAGKLREIEFTGIQPNGQRSQWTIQYGSRGKIRNMEVATGDNFRTVREGQSPRQQPLSTPAAQKWTHVSPK